MSIPLLLNFSLLSLFVPILNISRSAFMLDFFPGLIGHFSIGGFDMPGLGAHKFVTIIFSSLKASKSFVNSTAISNASLMGLISAK